MPTDGKIAGVVLEGATPQAGSVVRLYDRTTGALINSQTTNQWGAFLFDTLDSTLPNNYFLVALDPDGGAQYNAQVYDRLTAVTSLTRPVVSNGFEDSLFGTSSTAFSTYSGYIKGLTPLAYWRLKETSGTTFADEMGFAPMTAYGTSFLLNQPPALFDADGAAVTNPSASTTDYIGTGKITGLVGGATGFSIVAHVKLANSAGGLTLLSWRDYTAGGNDYTYATLTHDRNVGDDFSYESWSWATTATRPYALGVSDDRWHMTVLTYTAADNTMRLYIDGYLVDTKVQGTPPTFPNSASVTLFNNVDGASSQSTNCSLSEVAVFDKPLTATQVMMAATIWAQKAKLNPNDKAAGLTLSNSDMTATSTAGSWESVRATHRKTTGRWYWETVVTANPNNLGVLVGITPYSMATNQYPGQGSNSGGIWAKGAAASQYYAGGSIFRSSLTAIPVGAVIGHVYDAELGTHDVYLNGTPLASCYGFTPPHYPTIAVYGGGSATIKFKDFTHTPPEFCLPFIEADYPTPTPTGYWDAANKAAQWKLSKNPRLAYGVNSDTLVRSVRGLPSRNSGKRYFEIRIDRGAAVASTAIVVGVFGTSQTLSGATFPGNSSDSWGYACDAGASSSKRFNGGSAAYGATYGSGDVIGVAVDWAAGTIEFFKNGTSQGVAYTSGVGGTLYPGVSLYQLVVQAALNTGDVAFAYAPPAGFVAWNN